MTGCNGLTSNSLDDVVTVGDRVRLTKDLLGVVRFVGEIQARKGIYYGIELSESKGKSNGVVGNVRYFKCKAKRGLFLRFARIQEVMACDSISRIGIGDYVRLYVNSRKCVGQVRYIGTPNRCCDVYYGVQLRKAIGDSDGLFKGTRFFKTNSKFAHFLKSNSSNIQKMSAMQTSSSASHGRSSSSDSDGSYGHRRKRGKHSSLHTSNGSSSKISMIAVPTTTIELGIYADNNQPRHGPLFQIHLSSNFNYEELIAKIREMSQFVSTIFEMKFRKSRSMNGFNTDNDILLNAHEFNALRAHHSPKTHFYEYGKFIVIEPLIDGVVFEEKGMFVEALEIYQRAVDKCPTSTEALTYYANCLVLVEKLESAEIFYKRALELNPFAGDICYFYTRLLEYCNKYNEGKILCSEVINYAKTMKSAIPPAHHEIHYSCYARLGQKYIQLSMDRHNRQKMSVQQTLDRYTKDKQELQSKIERLEKDVKLSKQLHHRNGHNSSPNAAMNNQSLNELRIEKKQMLTNMKLLNDKIERLEAQFSKQETILQRKEREIIAQENEISRLKHELAVAKKEAKISAAKVLSEKITDGVLPLKSTQSADISVYSPSIHRKQKKGKNTNLRGNEPSIPTSDYSPMFQKLNAMKEKQREKNERLRHDLLSGGSMKSLADITDVDERQLIMKQKLELCSVLCNFEICKDENNDDNSDEEINNNNNNNTNDDDDDDNNIKSEEIKEEMQRINNKKDLLLEVLQCMSGNKWNSIELLKQCIETICKNLFRALPDEYMIRTDPNDDEMDFRDPGWDHLQLIYELTFHVVTNTHIDKKTMKKHLQGSFLENLIHLFGSCDDREPQYVKIIVHAIYGRFMALRKAIRKHLSDYCYRYIYTSTFRDTNAWQGLPEILEIFCSVFQGLNVPVKPDYHIVLRNVIVPLHKSFHLDEFHEQLLQCCTQFVTKDPHSAPVIMGGVLKFWPKFSPLKEQLFITEIVHILNVCIRHPHVKQSDPAFATITIAVLLKFVDCMTSPHHQVAERSLMVWRDETVRICVDLHREKIWPKIYKALLENKEKYWLSAIRNINRQIMSDFKRRDPEFFEKLEKQHQSLDEKFDENEKLRIQKKEQRENRWLKLKQFALQSNK